MSTQNGANWKISKTKQNKQNKQTIPPPPHPKKTLTNSHNRSQNMHKKLQIKMGTTHLFQHLRQKKQKQKTHTIKHNQTMEIPAADDVQPKCKQITCCWSTR